MSGRRLGLLAALLSVAIVVYLSVTPAGAPAAPHHALAAPAGSSDPYPRLANYNGLRYAAQVPFFASYGLVIARRGAPVRQLERADPHVVTLLYERTLQGDLCCLRSLYGLSTSQVPPGWWLVTVGSRLSASIDARRAWIPVADPRPFARCQDVLVDGESMHVWSVRGHMLHVLRGYYSAARSHRSGVRVAPHYSYRSDLPNCHLSGAAASIRPWSFNLSSRCPRWHGQTWADYLAHRLATLVQREGWNGVFYDNVADYPPSLLVDVNGDGRADGGVLDGVDTWRAGERALLAETRRLLPRATLLVNGDLRIDGVADGREMEGFPVIPGLALSAAIDSYLYDGAHGAPFSIINADSVAQPLPSVPAARLAVAAALLGDGYAAYDYGWLNHGWPWWFDEYDGSAGSAALYPIDAASRIVPVAHPGRFHRGDTVLFEMDAARVLRVLHGALLLQRGAFGTLPAWHEARTILTTVAQRQHGRGYLGRPLGPSRLEVTAPWRRSVPLRIVAAPTPRQGGTDVVVGPVGPHTVLTLDLQRRYDPTAAQVILHGATAPHSLHTLVFSARGPDGERFTVDDGHVAAPLVLSSSWRRYVLPVAGPDRLALEFGRVGGHVQVRDLQLVAGQAFVLRRDFSGGIVLLNPTDARQTVTLAHPYRRLAGDQDPWTNMVAPITQVTLGRYTGLILLNAAL